MAVQISTTETEGGLVIKVTGEVDLYSSPELRGAISKATSAAQSTVAVDLSEVPYMDSSGVATLVEGLRATSQKDGAFVLLTPSTSVMKVLQLARLNTVFDIRDCL